MDSTAKAFDDNVALFREKPPQRRANLARKEASPTALDLCLELPILTDIVDDPYCLHASSQK